MTDVCVANDMAEPSLLPPGSGLQGLREEIMVGTRRAQAGLHRRGRIGSSLFAIARHPDRARQCDHPEAKVREELLPTADTSRGTRQGVIGRPEATL